MSQVLDREEGEQTPATKEAKSQAVGYYGETLSIIANPSNSQADIAAYCPSGNWRIRIRRHFTCRSDHYDVAILVARWALSTAGDQPQSQAAQNVLEPRPLRTHR